MLTLVSALAFGQNAAQARKILDKTASIVGRKGGAAANFSISGKYGNTSGTIAIKGNKFRANTPDAIIWYDGKTEWAASNHGTWSQSDSHIPLIFMGWHITPGETSRLTHMTDIAATVCAILHIQAPNGCIGTPIFEL